MASSECWTVLKCALLYLSCSTPTAIWRIENMQETLKQIVAWRSPSLTPSKFGCVAVLRDQRTEPSSKELADLVQLLPKHLDFDARFHTDTDSYWNDEPMRDQYSNDEEYGDAYQEFLHERRFSPKPWQPLFKDKEAIFGLIEKEIRNAGIKPEHEEGLGDFMNLIDEACKTSAKFWLYEADHLFDISYDPKPESANAEAYAGCFFDQSHALFTDQIAILIWTGYPRAYG